MDQLVAASWSKGMAGGGRDDTKMDCDESFGKEIVLSDALSSLEVEMPCLNLSYAASLCTVPHCC